MTKEATEDGVLGNGRGQTWEGRRPTWEAWRLVETDWREVGSVTFFFCVSESVSAGNDKV